MSIISLHYYIIHEFHPVHLNRFMNVLYNNAYLKLFYYVPNFTINLYINIKYHKMIFRHNPLVGTAIKYGKRPLY